MTDDSLDEEFSIMYKESEKSKSLDSETFRKPIRNLKVPKPITVEVGTYVQEALTLMQLKQFGCVVVTREERLAGILTERDIIMKALGEDFHLAEMKVNEIMTPDPETFQPQDSIAFVMNAMVVGGYRHVPVVDKEDIPLAVVSVRDIISYIVEHFSEEILNLPPKPVRRSGTLEGG